MCSSNGRSHFYHWSEVSLTSGRPMVLGAEWCVAQKRWGQRNAEKDRLFFVCLYICVFICVQQVVTLITALELIVYMY